jgi:hypothetical protein
MIWKKLKTQLINQKQNALIIAAGLVVDLKNILKISKMYVRFWWKNFIQRQLDSYKKNGIERYFS